MNKTIDRKSLKKYKKGGRMMMDAEDLAEIKKGRRPSAAEERAEGKKKKKTGVHKKKK